MKVFICMDDEDCIEKLSELLGNINVVIFTPDDIHILKGGPQNRRRFLDIMIML